jgi:hemerythrin-like metal-binding protein
MPDQVWMQSLEVFARYIQDVRSAHLPLLSWKPEYSVNKAELDSHHQKMFDILNTAYEHVMNTLEVACVLPVIDELSTVTNCHIAAEEQQMREIGFQGIDAHIAEHREFTQKIEALKTNYQGNNLEDTKELIILLGEWLLHHVLKEDKKYSYEMS